MGEASVGVGVGVEEVNYHHLCLTVEGHHTYPCRVLTVLLDEDGCR